LLNANKAIAELLNVGQPGEIEHMGVVVNGQIVVARAYAKILHFFRTSRNK